MIKGPQLNKNKFRFSSRDSLGIEGVAASMSADACPIVNTVTPRAFYWPFMVWIYYDFYKYSGITDHTREAFDRYLKRQDYFFVMATLLVGGDENNLVGKEQAQKDIKETDGPYTFNSNYFKSRYGGMQYYNAGCLTMRFITDVDADGNSLKFPKLTPTGEEMALAFESLIKNTEYFKTYRRNDLAVPKDVLIELGNILSLSLKGFDQPKKLLIKRLVKPNPKLQKCFEYLKYLHDKYGLDDLSIYDARRIFFDHEMPDGTKIDSKDELKGVMDAWEIIIGRMYFTLGLEMIWKPMLEEIEVPMTMNEWISTMFDVSDFTWDINKTVESVLPECIFDFSTREDMIDDTRLVRSEGEDVENGLKIVLSMYNWISSRNDLDDERSFLAYGYDSNSISLEEFVDTVESYKNRSIKEFLMFIMKEWLIEQHYITAFEKTLYGIDGFFYTIINGLYYKSETFRINYQGNRMVQLMQVLKDLDMFS